MATETMNSSEEIKEISFEEEDEDDNEQNKLNLKHKISITITIITLISIAYFISILLSTILCTLIALIGGFIWFSSTDLSVEITVFLGKFFPPAASPLIDCTNTPQCKWSAEFRKHWKIIYKEYLNFEDKYNYRPQMDDVYPNGSITNWDRKWPTVNLRVYGLDTDIAKYFPQTMELVNNSDTWLSHVMFSILRPNKFIPRHRGPYRGVFRYHLSLEIPEHKSMENELYLAVWPNTSSVDFWNPENVPDNEPLMIGWKDGSDFLFDDTCVHEVINFTGKRRIILFMDVERYDISWFSILVHRFFMNLAKYLPTVQKCKQVQDEYLKTCIDKKTKEPMRWGKKDVQNGVIKDEMDCNLSNSSPSNSWLWYNTAPEILPFKKARVVIKQRKKNNQKDK